MFGSGSSAYIYILVGALFLPLASLVFFPPKLSPNTLGVNSGCVLTVDTTKTQDFAGSTYNLFQSAVTFNKNEIENSNPNNQHLIKSGQINTKDVYLVNFHSNGDPVSVNWNLQDPKFNAQLKELLYLKIADNGDQNWTFDIYLKSGAAIPQIATQFCADKISTANLYVNSDTPFPPLSIKFDPTKITRINASKLPAIDPNLNYHLISYSTTISPVFKDIGGGGSKNYLYGTIDFEINKQTKTFRIFYNPDSAIQYVELVENATPSASNLVFRYTDDRFYTAPTPSAGQADKKVQIKTLDVNKIYPWAWWTPECKPAIYLYPSQETNYNVRVNPVGYLTYTNPKYPESGWEVSAKPTGQLTVSGSMYDYLYYESKILDSSIEIPTTGVISSFEALDQTYQTLLPSLGLNASETKDFRDYWKKYLPYSPYYFLGTMSESSIDKIEPLTISPAPDTAIRVRIYFQPLTQFEALKKQHETPLPNAQPKPRLGSTMVEWGGMVKQDKNHPFTCSM